MDRYEDVRRRQKKRRRGMKLKDLTDSDLSVLAKNGYRDWLAKNGYCDWLTKNGYLYLDDNLPPEIEAVLKGGGG
jgi:hypothetical protein